MKLEDLIHWIDKIDKIKSKIDYKYLTGWQYAAVCEENDRSKLYPGRVYTMNGKRIYIVDIDYMEYVEVE